MEKCAVAKSFPGSIFISVIVVAGIMKIKYILPMVFVLIGGGLAVQYLLMRH